MKKLVSFIALCLVAVISSAQTTDFRGVKVSKSGNTYTATFSKKSANGGSAFEKWTGPLVNGKRSGTWTFTGTYKQYVMDGGRCRNGSVKMTRNYKNGKPDGVYSVTYNITERNASYNYFTDTWRYGEQHDMTERVSGSFIDGKPNGTWNIFSERFHETWTAHFKSGYADGTWKNTTGGYSQKIEFKNGYGFHQRVPEDDGSWGYELSYDVDPATLQPQDTIRVGDKMFFYWDTYSRGLFLITDWMINYPKNASDESAKAYYILSDFKNHYKPYGNVPQRVYDKIESDKINELVRQADEFASDTLLRAYQNYSKVNQNNPFYLFCRKLNEDALSQRNRTALLPSEWAEYKYLRDSVVNGKYKDRVEYFVSELNKVGRNSRELDHIIAMTNEVTDTCILYEAGMLRMRQDLPKYGIENPTDEQIWRLFRSPELKEIKQRYQEKQDSIAIRRALVISEMDIDYYVMVKCFEYYSANGRITGAKQIVEDPTTISKNDIIDFAVNYSDKNNLRYYGSNELIRMVTFYVENSPGNIVAKNKKKLIKKLKKQFGL